MVYLVPVFHKEMRWCTVVLSCTAEVLGPFSPEWRRWLPSGLALKELRGLSWFARFGPVAISI